MSVETGGQADDTSDGEPEYGSVLSWIGGLVGGYVAIVLLFGTLLMASASPALLFLPGVVPESVPYMWLAVVGFLIAYSGADLSDEEADLTEHFMSKIQEGNRYEKFWYFMSFFVVAVGAVTLEVAFIGTAGSLIATETAMPIVAVAFAVWTPPVDIWAGNKFGLNLFSIGALVAMAALYFAAIVSRTPLSIPREAAADFRSSVYH